MSSTSLYYTASAMPTATPRPSHSTTTKRRVRFTFGYSSRTPSYGSLPPSPTDRLTKDDSSPSSTPTPTSTSSSSAQSSTILISTSLPIMHMPNPTDTTPSTIKQQSSSSSSASKHTKSNNITPTADDLTAVIPTRTSSITSTTSTLTPLSRSTSRCSNSSINSGFSSLDHRTMPRNTTAHKSNSSISSSCYTPMSPPTSPRPFSPAPQASTPVSVDTVPAATSATTRRPSVIERSAFLASAPVRSRAQISPRLKNMCPAPSTATFFNNTSIPSLATRCFTPPSSSCCLSGVSLEKRRWSNDSTRGLYGSAESTTSSGTLAFLAAAGDEVTSGPRPSTSTTSSYEGGSSMVNEYSGELEVRKREKKKTKKAKKACPGLSLFSFMLKK